jgi:acetyl esterase/lipase
VLLTGPAALLLAACGGGDRSTREPAPGDLRPGALVRSAYGDDPAQFGYLGLPGRARPRGTVVLIHGGAWQATSDYTQMTPMGKALMELGYAVWGLEYRRLGNGGGWAATFEDVARGVDHLEKLSRLHPAGDNRVLTRQVAVLGHSAGAQLAVWAASRTKSTPGGAPAFPLSGAVSLAGPLDLTAAARFPDLGEPVRDLMGGPPERVPDHYRAGDPTLLVPASVPVWVVQAVYDTQVPSTQGTDYVAAARRAGGRARLVQVPGSHQTVIDPDAASWVTISRCVAQATRQPAGIT